MRKERFISLDNGLTFSSVENLTQEDWAYIDDIWDDLASLMDADAREHTHNEYAPCTRREFLKGYLKNCQYDLIMG